MRDVSLRSSFLRFWSLITDKVETENEGWTVQIPASGAELRHLNNSSAFNPFWVVGVDENVTPEHNSIFQENINYFIEDNITCQITHDNTFKLTPLSVSHKHSSRAYTLTLFDR